MQNSTLFPHSLGQKPLTLIKLGGSIITNKEIPMQLRSEVLRRLVREIVAAAKKSPDQLFIVGHGQGSFGHVPALKYQTMQGFVNEESLFGMTVVQDTAAQLNRLVVGEFLAAGWPAASFLMSNVLVTKLRQPADFKLAVLDRYLASGIIPVTGGDVLVDEGQGCTIWSTEEVLAFFAEQWLSQKRQLPHILHVTEVPGVYDQQQQIIAEITRSNWPQYHSAMMRTKGFDVTGGMTNKITESLRMADQGVTSKILSGLIPGNLEQCLLAGKWQGTTISP